MDKGLPTFADLNAAYKRKSGETEAKKERRERRKNRKRNRRRRDDESSLGTTPNNSNNDEGYIDDNGNEATTGRGPSSSPPKIPPTFCNVSQDNVLQPGSSRRKSRKSESQNPGSEGSSSSEKEERRRRRREERSGVSGADEADVGNNGLVGVGQKDSAAAECEMGRGNAPYSSSSTSTAAAADRDPSGGGGMELDDEDYENILFQEPIPRLTVHPIDQDTPPPSVEDPNRSLDMPYLGDIPVDMTEIFNLQDQFQQQHRQEQQQQQRQIGQTPLSYSDQDYHMVPFISGQPTPASSTATTSPPSSPPEDSAAATPATPADQARQNFQNHPNLGDLLSSESGPLSLDQQQQEQQQQQQQQQQQMSRTPHPFSDASYQPPTSVLSHTSDMSEADGGVTVSSLTMLENRRAAREMKLTTISDSEIQTKKHITSSPRSSSQRTHDFSSSSESEVEDSSHKTVIHVQREKSEWLHCKVR